MSSGRETKYRFGVNYVPSRNWFYSWQKLNFDDVKRDFEAISTLGVDHIRMHLRWDLFQLNGKYVAEDMLYSLRHILDIAEDYQLMVQVTVLDGWMSGFWFMPSFTWDKHIFTDEEQIANQLFLLERISKIVGNHNSLMGIDLGNEINVYEMLRKYSIEEGDYWLSKVMAKTEKLFPGKRNVVGVDHQPWFADKQMSRKLLANVGNATSLHTWVAFTGALDYGYESEEAVCLQEYNIELANAYAENLERPVWIQEFGISPLWISEDKFRSFLYETMMNATRSDNLWGYTFWCSHDVSRKFVGFNEAEYDLGLFDCENRLKPVGKIYKDCIDAIKNGDRPKELQKGSAIVIREQELFEGWKYGELFSDNIRKGKHCKFVLESKVNDKQYLNSRGISELI